jgi:hypothetical protein
MTCKHVDFPPHGERISVSEDSSLNIPAGRIEGL